MIVPVWDSVAALYCLTKSMIAMPWGPSAVPTGGAGVALPAGIWIFTTAATCFLAMGPYLFVVLHHGRRLTGGGASVRPDALLGASSRQVCQAAPGRPKAAADRPVGVRAGRSG